MIDWMKYAEIQTLKQKGFKKARVARMLHINRETVDKYWETLNTNLEFTQ